MRAKDKTVERMMELIASDDIYTLTENKVLCKFHFGLPEGVLEIRDILKDKRMKSVYKKFLEIEIDLERHIKNLLGEDLHEEIRESDIMGALIHLGYKKTQAKKGLAAAIQQLGPGATQEQVMKAAIQLAQ